MEKKASILPSDETILDLYWDRDEQAIAYSNEKYGPYCYTVAYNILKIHEDSEECVSDTWVRSWQAIPPERPSLLKMFFAKITRGLSLDRYRMHHAMKRGGNETALVLDELTECVSGKDDVESQIAYEELVKSINTFLNTSGQRERVIFIRRYFFMEDTACIARKFGLREANVRKILSRTRKQLKEYLEKEGYSL